MAIANFGDLKTAIRDWLNRSSDNLTAVPLGQFVLAVEADLRNEIETREHEQLATGTMSGDGFTAPADYLRTRTLVVDEHFYSYLTPEQYAEKVDNESTGFWYTINGNDFSVLDGDGKAYELLYYAKITALSGDADSNWILANAPEVYLFGGVMYGSLHLKDWEGADRFGGLYSAAKARLNNLERKARYGGPLVVRPG